MASYTMIVLTNAKDGRDAELVEWFDSVHLAEMLALPGCTTAQRLPLASIPSVPSPHWTHAALYTVETDDVAGFNDTMFRQYMEGKLTQCDALHEVSYNGIFEASCPVLSKG